MDQDTIATSTTTESTAPAGEATRAIDPPSAGLHELSKADRDSFYSTGKVPDKKADEPDASADSSTAPSGEQSAEIAAKSKAPASEPGKPAKDKKVARNADERVTELLTDRTRERDRADRAERELDAVKQRLGALEKPKQDAKPDSSPAADPSEPEWKKYRAMKDAPKADDFETLDDYVAAMGLFVTKHAAKEQVDSTLTARDRQSAEYAEAERHMQSVIDTAATRLEAEKAADPTLHDAIDPMFRKITPARLLEEGQAIGPHHYAKDFIMFECETPGALSKFYSSDEGRAEWQRMMTMPRRQLERTIIARELSLGSSATGQHATGAAPKTFTKTPPPPEAAGKKPSAVGDPAEKAVKGGDFRGFMRAMDEREGVTSRFSR